MRFTLLLILILPFSSFAQKQVVYENTPAILVIKELEDVFPIRFSYNSAILSDIHINYQGKLLLQSIIDSIAQQHDIQFEFLDDENIIISKITPLQETSTFYTSLEEVVVLTEYLTSGFDQNKKNSSMLVQPEKLGILPGFSEPDVFQSLQLLPGIASPDESASGLHIRGSTPDQNLILFDGIKTYHQGHLFGMISPFNPNVIDKVEVYRSGTSALYGERIAGVIDIKTSNQIPQKTKVNGGINPLYTDISIQTPIQDKLAIIFSARRSLTDVWQSPTFERFSDKIYQNTKIEEVNDIRIEEELQILENKLQFTDLTAKVLFQPNEHHKISLSGLSIDNTLRHGNIDVDNEGSRDDLQLTNRGAALSWTGSLFPKLQLHSKAYVTDYESQYKNQQLPIEVDESENIFKENQVFDFGFLINGKIRFSQKQALTIGYDFSDYDVLYNLRFTGDENFAEREEQQLQTHNFFSEYEIDIDKASIRLGTRTSYFVQNASLFFEPRIYAEYKIQKNLKLKSSIEIKNQGIDQLVTFDFNELGLDNTVWTLANNDDILVLNNKQATAGFLFSKNGWKIDLEGYYKRVKGLNSLSRGFSSVSEEFISGSSTTYGFDLLIKKRIKKFRTWIAYSWNKQDFLFSEFQEQTFPGVFDVRHSLNWSGSIKFKKIQFALGWQYTSGKPFTSPTGITTIDTDEEPESELEFDTLNQSRLNGYHRMDTSILYDFSIRTKKDIKGSIGLSIINVYDQKNELGKRFELEDDDTENVFISEISEIGLRFTPSIVFRVQF